MILAGSLTAEQKNITVEDCVKIAKENNPNIFVSIEDKKNAASNYKLIRSQSSIFVQGEARTAEYLKATSSDSNFNIPGKDTTIGLFAGLSASYSLYDPKKVDNELSAKMSIDLSKIDAQRTISDIELNVRKSYWGYVMAVETTRLRMRLLEKSQEKLNQAKILYKNGQRPILDVSKAEIAFNESLLEFEKSRNEERLIKSQLFTAMGIAENGVDAIPVYSSVLPELKFSLDEIISMGEIYAPSLRMIRIKKNISKVKISAESSNHYPKVEVLFALGYENKQLMGYSQFQENFNMGNWSPSFHATARASFPVYTGGGISAKVESAESEYNKMIYKERETVMELNSSVKNLYITINELSKQINMSKMIIDNSKKYSILAQKSYEKGAGSLLELQDAEVTEIKSELSYLLARYNYLLAISRLSNLIGVGEDVLCKK